LDLAGGAAGLHLSVVAMAVLAAVIVLMALVIAGRVNLRRSVLVHAPADHAWEFVRHFPTLHTRHGKARELCPITEWVLRRGDGERSGTVWRALGTWGGAGYWADVEIVRNDPGRELTVSLRGDSLGTHRGLRGHLGSLTIEPVGSAATNVTWRLRARLRGPRLILERLGAGPRLYARLLDQGLRSLKVEIDGAAQRVVEDTLQPAGRADVSETPPPRPMRSPPETSV